MCCGVALNHEAFQIGQRRFCQGTPTRDGLVARGRIACAGGLAGEHRRRSTTDTSSEKPEWRDANQTRRQMADGPKISLAGGGSRKFRKHWGGNRGGAKPPLAVLI